MVGAVAGGRNMNGDAMKDPYRVLGVSRDADQPEIKRVYRKLAKELHPDSHPGDTHTAERFKEVSAAYSIVGDEDTRRKFDRGEINAAGQQQGPGAGFRRGQTGPGGGAEGFQGFGGGGMEDLFADLFSGRRRGQRRGARARQGTDQRYTLRIDFVEAARGATRRLSLPGGSTLDVRIPAGIESGQQIRLKGKGELDPDSGLAGDALIEIQVEPHPIFTRSGLDVHVELPVTLPEAVLGGAITAPTVHGDVTLKVPKHSNTGATLRLKGKGIKGSKADRTGDQYVKLKIVLPEKIDSELVKLVERWAKAHDYDVRAGFKAG